MESLALLVPRRRRLFDPNEPEFGAGQAIGEIPPSRVPVIAFGWREVIVRPGCNAITHPLSHGFVRWFDAHVYRRAGIHGCA